MILGTCAESARKSAGSARKSAGLPYVPFFCEENIFRLCDLLSQDSAWQPMRSIVAFATNARRQVAMFCQRSDARRVVLWDYHVVLVTPAKPGFRASSEEPSPSQGGWVVWDPEFAPPPVAGSHAPDSFDLQFYLRAAFSVSPDGRGSQDAPGHDIPSGYRPQFRLIPAELYVRDFGSDRHHMRDDQGRPTVPFPEWPLIRPERYECLEEILDLKSKKWGRWVTLEELWNTPAPY